MNDFLTWNINEKHFLLRKKNELLFISCYKIFNLIDLEMTRNIISFCIMNYYYYC